MSLARRLRGLALSIGLVPLGTTAIAAGVSSLLTAIGFASLLPVNNAGLRSIGLLAVMGIGIAYVVNVIMFIAFQWIARPTKVVAK